MKTKLFMLELINFQMVYKKPHFISLLLKNAINEYNICIVYF